MFVKQLYLDPNDEKWDNRLQNIEQAWSWARAKSWLNDFINSGDVASIERQVHILDQDINENMADLAALRSWKFCFGRMTESIRRSLVGWQDNVRLVGKGTGRHAPKYRRQAQRHLNECKGAIPAWIMPLHRVWDTVRPSPGVFDLIIVDEASQCGWQAIPLLYFAKRMIIVGDDQQISPQSVGINKDNVQALMDEFLHDFEQVDSFDAENSLFGHARRRFSAPIVLREHFRCMPEIIRFSNDLCYRETPLIPLRQYPPQRLEPLVSRHIISGYREGRGEKVINIPEAEEIVKVIIECCKDKRYVAKTMGVITLQGKAQAHLIERLLWKKIDGEDITADDLFQKRRLVCGDPYSFQGDERNIIFLSMVAAPNEVISALTKQDHQKRFNVAASRAQDQMWLFHTPTLQDLPASCFRKKLLEHFINPISNIHKALGENADRLRELAHTAHRDIEKPPKPFDSWFEVDVALIIASRGYRVIPQFPVIENKRIDLVVEGNQSRLAVECDGDYWHSGPEKLEDDLERQRKLERCGWTFFRIRGSEFRFFQEETMNKLWRVLESHGIHPIGFTAPEEQTSEEDIFGSEQNLNVDQNKSGASDSIFDKTVATEDEEADTHFPEKKVFSKEDSLASGPGQNPPVIFGTGSIESEPNNTISGEGGPLFKQAPYDTFEGTGLDDPGTSRKGNIAEGLCRIVEIEGPMLAKKAYDVYLRKCGIRRLGGALKKIMNKAMQYAISSGKIESEDEWGKGGLIFSIVRVKDSLPIKLRKLGTRQFDEIPPSELQVASFLVKKKNRELSDEEHLRDVLSLYDLKRLTSAVKSTFIEANKTSFSYVNEYIIQKRSDN